MYNDGGLFDTTARAATRALTFGDEGVIYDLICEGKCNPNVTVIDRIASQFMSERNTIDLSNGGRHRADDLVRMQRLLKYTPHIRDDVDPRYMICGMCAAKRKFGG